MKSTTVLFLMLLFSRSALASFISIETEFMVTATDDGPVVSIGTRNKGDESAINVQVEISILGKQYAGPRYSKLEVNGKVDSDFRIGKVFDRPGHYPVVIKTHYQDANGYPFSALTAGFYDVGGPSLSKVLIRAEPLSIAENGRGRLVFELRNTDTSPHMVSYQLYLPDELVATEGIGKIELHPSELVEIEVDVENYSALVNSGYSVLFLASYEDGGRYLSSSGSTSVTITAPTLIGKYADLVPLLSVLLVASAGLLVWVVRRKR